ncbi:hypothetical protein E8E14_010837 [Neopestalotiopsis sp. 37M]|nr:hypothetical protein E8E14_010837 [Neopestalotiopsis sp. 37M]
MIRAASTDSGEAAYASFAFAETSMRIVDHLVTSSKETPRRPALRSSVPAGYVIAAAVGPARPGIITGLRPGAQPIVSQLNQLQEPRRTQMYICLMTFACRCDGKRMQTPLNVRTTIVCLRDSFQI